MMLQYLHVGKELLVTDLILMRQKLMSITINTLIWVTSGAISATYILPCLGMAQSYASMMLVASAVSIGIFESFVNTSTIVSDLYGERIISYQLTLPIPGIMLLAQKALAFALRSFTVALCVLPIGKLVMGKHLVLSDISIGKFIVALAAAHLFTGCLGLFLASYTPGMQYVFNAWTRIVFPMWFFGGSQFNWYSFKSVFPIGAYINLANPATYAFEAVKSAALPHTHHLPFWLCIGMLILFSGLALFISHKKLQRRLDYL
jgi:hypothetical protein